MVPNRKIYKVAVSYLEDLPTQIGNPSFEDDVNNLEEDSFSQYGYAYVQDMSDVKDDINQPGFIGVGIEDKGKLQGYLYGYKFIYEDNWEDYMDEIPIAARARHYFTIRKLKKAAKAGEILYVANLAVNKDYRIFLDRLFKKFVEKIKASQYKYIVADMLSDSAKLLTDGNTGKVREDRITRYGLKLISFGDIQDEESKIIVLEI